MATTTEHSEHEQPERLQPTRRGHIGLIVAGSFAAGIFIALALVAAPFVEADENALTGVVLLGFALGWALLAVLSVRFSDQPQRWAAAPALFFGLAGLMSLIGSDTVNSVFGWVWPPVLLGVAVWMIIRARRQLHSRSRRWLLYPVLAILIVASVGGGYETVRESLDTNAYPMPGQLVDVGGHSLHLNCTGSGSPTVVLEPGLGEASWVMSWIAPEVARDSRVCVYDRAGRGWSQGVVGPQDGIQIAADLHTLLDRAHIRSCARWSLVRRPVHSRLRRRIPGPGCGHGVADSTAKIGPVAGDQTGSYDLLGRISALLPAAAHLGVARLYGQFSYGSLPSRARDEARASIATARNVRSFIDELSASAFAVQQAASLVDLADRPLIVITAGREHDAQWFSAQQKMATLSTNSRHRVVANATHPSLLVDPTDAAAASQAVRDVIVSVRTSRPLAPP